MGHGRRDTAWHGLQCEHSVPQNCREVDLVEGAEGGCRGRKRGWWGWRIRLGRWWGGRSGSSAPPPPASAAAGLGAGRRDAARRCGGGGCGVRRGTSKRGGGGGRVREERKFVRVGGMGEGAELIRASIQGRRKLKAPKDLEAR